MPVHQDFPIDGVNKSTALRYGEPHSTGAALELKTLKFEFDCNTVDTGVKI